MRPGGTIACEDLLGSISAMCKLAVGFKLFEKINIGVFKQQQLSLDHDATAKISETLSTHPYLIKRIHAVQKFFESDSYCKIKGIHVIKKRIQGATRQKTHSQKSSYSVSAILITIFSLLLLLGAIWVVFTYNKPKAKVPYLETSAFDAMGKYWQQKHLDLEILRNAGFSEHEICKHFAEQIGDNPITSTRCSSLDKPIEKINEDLAPQVIDAYCFDVETAESDGFSKEKISHYLLLSRGLQSSPYTITIDETIAKYRCMSISEAGNRNKKG